MKCIKTILAAALLTTSLPACAQTHDEAQGALTDTQIDERLATTMSELETQGFSGVAAAARDGEIIAFAQAGAADPETGRAYTPDTQFDIGSIVKPITGLAASTLIAEGRLDAGATLGSFFENVPADKAGITVHQLLTHTAGLAPAHGFDRRPMSRTEMLAAIFAEDLISAPGERYAYSNSGPSLVAAIIEDITGQPFETYVREEVLTPLGIEDTGYRQAFDRARGDASAEHGPLDQASWGELDPVSWALIGNGGMVSTVNDLAKLGQGIATGAIDSRVLDIWITPRVDEGGGTMYGYGIGFQEIEGLGRVHWHNGGNPAFQTEWWTFMDSGITVIVHRNGGLSLGEALGPLLGAVTAGDFGFGGAGPEVEMTAGDELPDTPEGRLAHRFLTALRTDDAAWEAFVRADMSASLRESIPAEQHRAMFEMLSRDVGDRNLTAHGMSEAGVHLRLEGDATEPLIMVLLTSDELGSVKLRGIEAM
ncbi:MAG: serine hydrolase domain-containing protein [Erythrobacter sp.]